MNRRAFLVISGHGLGLAYLAPLSSCASTPSAAPAFDPGPYTVGDKFLIFGTDGSEFALDPLEHRVLGLDDRQRVESAFSSLGQDPAGLNHPADASIGSNGRLYVVDRGNDRVQVFDRGGRHLASFGSHGVAQGELNMPGAIAVRGDHVYVCDTLNNRVQEFDLEGTYVRSIGDAESLNGARGIAVAQNGELHVLDGGDASVHVFKPDGTSQRRYGGFGEDPGKMLAPESITVLADGRVFLSDATSGFVHVFAESGSFLGRFRPVDLSGKRVSPARVSTMHDGSLYIWTAGQDTHPGS